jgi:hypothetical protein
MRALRRLGLLTWVLWRPLWLRALFEVMIFAAVAAMGIFFVSWPLKAPIDAVVSLLRAPFERIAHVPPDLHPRGALAVLALSPVLVAPAKEYDANRSYIPHLIRVELQIADDLAAYDWLAAGADLLGGARPDGVRVDLDAAIYMGVGVGDEIVLLGAPWDGVPDVRLRVGGLLRPSPAQSPGENLLVVPTSFLPAEVLAAARSTPSIFTAESAWAVVFEPAPEEAVPAVSRGAAIASHLAELVNPLRFVGFVGIFAFSFGLWVVLLARSLGHVLGSLRARAAILAALGVRPTTIALAGLLPQLVVAAAGVGLATVAVRSVLFEFVLRRSLQGAILLPSLVPIAVILAVATLTARRVILRRLRGSDVVRDLTAEETM